ncbi:MAG: BolA family transcriptional regulator [Proteobacteria bacterium]|nr:BolA family transcriptional regulator [Pseudomonadota bacterium]
MSLQDRMKEGIKKIYNPLFLEIINDSDHHKGHKAVEGRIGKLETHFKITLVSNCFENLSRIQRHRQLYDSLKEILGEASFSEIHALSLKLVSPKEFEQNL